MIVKVSLNDARKTIKEDENLGYLHIGTVRTIDGVTLRFRDPIVTEENNITDIQFHEGDYVENKDGKIGYISSICHCDECKKRGFFEPTITYSDGTTDYFMNYFGLKDLDELPSAEALFEMQDESFDLFSHDGSEQIEAVSDDE